MAVISWSDTGKRRWRTPLAATGQAPLALAELAASTIREENCGMKGNPDREVLDAARSQRGESLAALSDAKPVLLVFLRHFG